ncbi:MULTISPECIES: hypothetical protein [unclassified Comamonas]|uniref:hypothetical protein n=1 Tax=unclassified Comamonas TaxID=2638500 RepID=UPI001FA7D6F8|nr:MULTISPECIES: hypothetical protein [unclassified Comamonas]UNV91836.1 hypothetical protein MP576_05630 [Comamonas sp. 7D-2evo1]UNV94862.1 hypothetical protein MPZ60_20710 [Comamonas sp. 7D-2]UNW01474.1 hypothetical protein MP579_05615 [Comamonas sp. 7D-2evo2]
MSAEELQSWKDRLTRYLDAEKRILDSQEYQIGQGSAARRNRRAELEQVQKGISECQQKIGQLQAASSPRGRRIVRLRPH